MYSGPLDNMRLAMNIEECRVEASYARCGNKGSLVREREIRTLIGIEAGNSSNPEQKLQPVAYSCLLEKLQDNMARICQNCTGSFRYLPLAEGQVQAFPE